MLRGAFTTFLLCSAAEGFTLPLAARRGRPLAATPSTYAKGQWRAAAPPSEPQELPTTSAVAVPDSRPAVAADDVPETLQEVATAVPEAAPELLIAEQAPELSLEEAAPEFLIDAVPEAPMAEAAAPELLVDAVEPVAVAEAAIPPAVAPAPAAPAPTPVSGAALEAELTAKVRAETERMSTRSKRMTELTSRLQASVARKAEVEQMVALEVAALREKLAAELAAEGERRDEVAALLEQFAGAIGEKSDYIEGEQRLLEQMQAVKSRVREESIRRQFEASMATKADLISIEVVLLEDMLDCRDQLAKELAETGRRSESMAAVVAALPAPEDPTAGRRFDWSDVMDLQKVLLDSIESMATSDAKVTALRTKFEDAVRQKRVLLGEIEPPSLEADEVISQSGRGPRPKASATGSALTLSRGREMADEELLAEATDGGKAAAEALGRTLSLGASSFGSYLRSPSAQATASLAVDLVEATKGYVTGLAAAAAAARDEFVGNLLPGQEVTTFDKLFKTIGDGLRAVKDSPRVAEDLRAATQAGAAVPKAVTGLAGEAAKAASGVDSNKEIRSAAGEALEAIRKAFVALAALGAKKLPVGRDTGRLLPPAPPADDDAIDG